MKQKIFRKAGEMFLKYGVKSVTMDDIANALGVSKKTIYTHYKTKKELIEKTVKTIFLEVMEGIDVIHQQEMNPIIEVFKIRQFITKNYTIEGRTPYFQLKKYYPEIFQDIQQQRFRFMQKHIKEIVNRGIDMGLFRKNLDVEFIFRIHLYGIDNIKNEDFFPPKMFNQTKLLDDFLEYHLRGISTKKGIETLEQELNKNNN